MRTQEHEVAIRRVVALLSRACCSHGHYRELFKAFEQANPELAKKHWESVGRNEETAGLTLGMKMEDAPAGAVTTVLDEYLFGDSMATLRMVAMLSERLSNISAAALMKTLGTASHDSGH